MRASVAIPISDKIGFVGEKMVKSDKERYAMIKLAIHQEKITMKNIYLCVSRAPKYVKQR